MKAQSPKYNIQLTLKADDYFAISEFADYMRQSKSAVIRDMLSELMPRVREFVVLCKEAEGQSEEHVKAAVIRYLRENQARLSSVQAEGAGLIGLAESEGLKGS